MTYQEFQAKLPNDTVYVDIAVESKTYTMVSHQYGKPFEPGSFGFGSGNLDPIDAVQNVLDDLTRKGYDSTTKTFK